MDTKQICKECGAPLASDAPQGLCPNCLMKVAMGSEAGIPGGSSERKPAPPIEEIGKYFPQFEILGFLGQGGMGAVYKARQPSLDRFVALKILPAQAAADAGFAERFNREARALAKLNHPNIVAVYDFGQADGLHYLVMEYVDGLNLRQLQQTGKLPPREALQIIPQICEALQFAHDEGVVHRDIKPENVMLDKKGRVKIADFGLARILGCEPESYRLTGAKDFMGTPHYMAPEQIEHPQAVDHRADIYSLGVVFYEMLTGELPLGKFQPPSKKVQVDVRLDEVVLHALEKEPDRRYQQASQVKTDLETIAHTHGDAAAAPEPARTERDAGSFEAARRQVKGPAIGLLITGIMNWLLIPLATMVIYWLVPGETTRGLTGLPSNGFVSACLASLVLCSFMIYAALKMMALEKRGAGTAASILAILVTPGNLIGLPMGIWALLVLNRPDVKAAFTRVAQPIRPAPAMDPVLQSVQNPATGLFITGILSWAVVPFTFVILWRLIHDAGPGQAANMFLSVGVLPMVVGTLMILAGQKMKRLEAYRLAVAACILPMAVLVFKMFGMLLTRSITIGPADLIGAPMGLWALVVLSRPNVKAAFARAALSSASAVPTARGPFSTAAAAILIAFGVMVLMGGTAGVAYLLLARSGPEQMQTVSVPPPAEIANAESAELQTARTQLRDLRERFTDEHPQVRALLDRISTLEQPSNDVADVPSEQHFAGGDTNKLYFLIGRSDDDVTGKNPRPVLLVLPGGDGGRDSHPFVKRIYKNALPDGYLVAQLVAPKWDDHQFANLVWPTEKSRHPAMKFSTEEFVNTVVADIEKTHPLDAKRVFTLSWSSGGPAGYATSLYTNTRVTGSFVAMSVFKPDELPELSAAKGHAYYLLHSPADFVPTNLTREVLVRMSEQARDSLNSNGAKVHLQTYPGGHGWHGDVFGMLGDGVRWLEQQTASIPKTKALFRF